MAKWDGSTFYNKSEINNGKEFSVSSVPTLSDINKIVNNILYLYRIPQKIVIGDMQKLFTPTVEYNKELQSLSIDNSANGDFSSRNVLKFSIDNNGKQVVDKEFFVSSGVKVFNLTGKGLAESVEYTLEYYAKDDEGRLADSEQGTIGGITLPSTSTSDASYGLRFELLKQSGSEAYRVQGASENRTQIVIPSHYNGKPIVEIADGAFRGLQIERLIIQENSYLAIDSSAFEDCTQLREVIGASDVWVQDSEIHWTPSDWVTIFWLGMRCFKNTKITGISLKALSIYPEAFYDTPITIANLETLFIASEAFEHCNIQNVFLRRPPLEEPDSDSRIAIASPNFSNKPILRTPASIQTFSQVIHLEKGVSFSSIEYNSNELWDF